MTYILSWFVIALIILDIILIPILFRKLIIYLKKDDWFDLNSSLSSGLPKLLKWLIYWMEGFVNLLIFLFVLAIIFGIFFVIFNCVVSIYNIVLSLVQKI